MGVKQGLLERGLLSAFLGVLAQSLEKFGRRAGALGFQDSFTGGGRRPSCGEALWPKTIGRQLGDRVTGGQSSGVLGRTGVPGEGY